MGLCPSRQVGLLFTLSLFLEGQEVFIGLCIDNYHA